MFNSCEYRIVQQPHILRSEFTESKLSLVQEGMLSGRFANLGESNQGAGDGGLSGFALPDRQTLINIIHFSNSQRYIYMRISNVRSEENHFWMLLL